MRNLLVLMLASAIVAPAMAQEKTTTTTTTKETTTVRTMEKTVSHDGFDMLGPPLWNVNDTSTVPPHRVDLRLSFKWMTSVFPADGHDQQDDFVLIPHVVFGITDCIEAWASNSAWVGNGGNVGPLRDGNYDSNVGALWRFKEQEGTWSPSMAVSENLRLPTGNSSNGLDAETRLLLTNQYDNGMRSHINVFGTTVNGNNDGSTRYPNTDGTFPEDRHFQWGIVAGMDGPLCDDGNVRWIADYMNRSSTGYGSKNMNILELGFQWKISDCDALSLAGQISLDGSGEVPNGGAGVTYSHSITW